MQLITLPCGPLAVNTYLVHDDEGGPCAVVDPGDGEAVLERLPTGKVQRKTEAGWLVTAGVVGKGVDMWLRSQMDYVTVQE